MKEETPEQKRLRLTQYLLKRQAQINMKAASKKSNETKKKDSIPDDNKQDKKNEF